MMITQEEQVRIAWDNIAKGYGEFVGPTHFWIGEEGVRRAGLEAGMSFLDVAAGSGALSIPAARLGAQVLSVDISPAMLKQLEMRARKENLNLETQVMDGHALGLEDDSFDVTGSQFGVMLFPDMPRGIREMTRVTKPGGRVLMTVFGNPRQVEFFSFFVSAIQTAVPGFDGPPMDPPPLPFQLQDPEKLKHEMIAAGLKEVRVETITEELKFETGKQLWNWLVNSNPIARQILSELKLSDEQVSLVQQSLEEKVRDRADNDRTAVLTSPINIGVGVKN